MRILKIISIVYIVTYGANVLFQEILAALSGKEIDGELMAGMPYYAALDALIAGVVLGCVRLLKKSRWTYEHLLWMVSAMILSASLFNYYFFDPVRAGSWSLPAYIAYSFVAMFISGITVVLIFNFAHTHKEQDQR